MCMGNTKSFFNNAAVLLQHNAVSTGAEDTISQLKSLLQAGEARIVTCFPAQKLKAGEARIVSCCPEQKLKAGGARIVSCCRHKSLKLEKLE